LLELNKIERFFFNTPEGVMIRSSELADFSREYFNLRQNMWLNFKSELCDVLGTNNAVVDYTHASSGYPCFRICQEQVIQDKLERIVLSISFLLPVYTYYHSIMDLSDQPVFPPPTIDFDLGKIENRLFYNTSKQLVNKHFHEYDELPGKIAESLLPGAATYMKSKGSATVYDVLFMDSLI